MLKDVDYIMVFGMLEIRVMMFVNGMCVVSEMNMVVEIVIVGVWIDVGSRFELVEINGIVYFLEYMFFKGMENRSIW